MSSFDPYDPAAFQRAFAATEKQSRAELLTSQLDPMSSSLRGISAVVSLVDLDPAAFEEGLRRALAGNPGNLTAARALAWFYLRGRRYAEAEAIYHAVEPRWPTYGELVYEHFRLLVLSSSEEAIRYLESRSGFFVHGARRLSYALQCGAGHGTITADELMARGQLVAAAALGISGRSKPSRAVHRATARLWEMFSTLANARSIALVGNGPNLRDSGFGSRIDEFDVVVRCNFPQIGAHANDVGTRTDIVMFNETLRPRLARLRERESAFATVPALGLHPEPDFVADPTNATLIDTPTLAAAGRSFLSEISYARSTTGLMAINLIVFFCQRPVTIFGFDFFADTDRPHYFGNQVGAYLGHELEYEGWFVRSFLAREFQDFIVDGHAVSP